MQVCLSALLSSYIIRQVSHNVNKSQYFVVCFLLFGVAFTMKAPDGRHKLWDACIPQLVDIGRASRYRQVAR